MSADSPISYLDGHRLYRALVAGIQRVVSRRDYINKINVFPVPDGDTGTNMAFTLTAILDGVRGTMQGSVAAVVNAAADSAIDGARGNSGAILAQFFQGLTEGVRDRRVIDAGQFAQATASGSDSARLAMAEPREGTILTVISDFASEIGEQVRGGVRDFSVLIERGLRRAKASLVATTDQLEELRRANVVDAGAQGFVDLIQGIHEYIQSGSVREFDESVPEMEQMADAHLGEAHEGDPEHRYCTECVVSGDAVSRESLMELAQQMTHSSLVVAGHAGKVRVHIHVDDPGAFFKACESLGRLTGQKADDMVLQQRSAHEDAAQVAVVTDSGADIPASELDRLGIHMVPVTVNFGERSYLDKLALKPDEFYRMLRSEPEHPKTSQPSPGEFRRPYQFLTSHHERVVSVNVSRNLSGTLQAAETAAQRVGTQSISVIDSKNASAGEGLLAMYAAEAAQAGLTGDEVKLLTEAMVPRSLTYAVISDLSWGVRGGRIPRSKKIIADLLRMSPIIGNSEDGRLVSKGVLFGRRKLVAPFARAILKRLDHSRSWRILIGHCDCPERAEELRRLLQQALPNIDALWLTEAGTAIGAHAGPGSVVLGVQDYQQPHDLLAQLTQTDNHQGDNHLGGG